ncbi:putative nuclease HARBI1 [Nasonia vitripennis]|uniref:DDE Tnp4 domain-containing protein n=1 Tax=Nasonia vitripennis TaxID=7425 RepID=A0A7M7R478_NASVI|nr:putative nuclease HARBI1 [Nasonia vitripennis]
MDEDNFVDIIINDARQLINRFVFNQMNLLKRQLRDVSNPFIMPINIFMRYYRMPPHVVINLTNLLQHRLVGERYSIPLHLIVLSMLRFFAEGSFQKGFASDYRHPMGQSTASRYLTQFLQAVLELAPRFIRFPTSQEERRQISTQFQRTIRIPGIIGLVDAFIVCMKRPSENEEAFYNYRHGPAMNVQIVVDCNYIIRSIRIISGSNNDQFNWNFCGARDYLELLRRNPEIIENEGHYYMLGDSGYARSSVLLTPILDAPEGSPASVYTYDHVHTRYMVEQTIGMLSGTWKVISRCRKLYYSPQKVSMIINAAAILYNFERMHGV